MCARCAVQDFRKFHSNTLCSAVCFNGFYGFQIRQQFEVTHANTFRRETVQM